MKIIAFGHRREVGKDTAATFLVSYLRTNKKGISVRKLGFASKLKEISHSLYSWAGLKDEEYYEQNYKEKEVVLPTLGKTPRQIWIEVGNYMRQVHNDTWLAYLFLGVKADYMILKDLRFPNEAEAVKKHGGLVIRIDRASVQKHDDYADSALAEYKDWDYVWENNGSLREFNSSILDFAREINL